MPLSAEQSSRLTILQHTILQGVPPDQELELAREAVAILAQDRAAASVASGKAKAEKAAAKAPVDVASVLNNLRNLGKS